MPREHLWRWGARGLGVLLLAVCLWFSLRLGIGLLFVPLGVLVLIGAALRRQRGVGAMLLAVLIVAGFRLGEAYGLSRHRDFAAQQRLVGLSARGLEPIAVLGDDESRAGALHAPVLAFYANANRVLPRLDADGLQRALETQEVLYLIAPAGPLPLPAGVHAEPVFTQPKLGLWRLSKE